MSFVPRHQARTPRYDVYDEVQDASTDTYSGLGAGCEGSYATRVVNDDEDASTPSNSAPMHSTPVGTDIPPLLAQGVSTVATDTSDSRQTPHSATVSSRPAAPVHKASSTESSSNRILGEFSLINDVSKMAGIQDASLFSKSGSWTSSTSLSSRLYHQPHVPHYMTTTTNSAPCTRGIKARTPASNVGNKTPGSGRLKTPGSGRLKTPGSAPSRTSGSGRSKTPGSGMSRTPGSAASRTPRSAQELSPSTIVAVVEGRGQARGEVGVAAIDLRSPQLSLAQFSDTHTYTRTLTKLTILNPLEVIVATTAVQLDARGGGGGSGGLLRVVQDCVPSASVTAVHRRYFNDTRGLAIVKHLAAPHCAYIERHVATKYYCLAAVAAVMKYVEHIQHVTYAPHSLLVSLSSSENTMTIEYSSCRKLELVRSLRGGWEESLFGALRHTRTPAGTRLLRASLLQPHADAATITTRLDTLQYLVEHSDLFYTLQSILGRFPDVDWLLSMCVQVPKEETEQRCELRLNYVIALKNTLELLDPLANALVGVTDPLLLSVREAVRSTVLRELLEVLRQVLHEDARLVKGAAAMRTQRCYAIRSHVNGLLDVARKIYSEIIDDITEHVESTGREHGVCARVGHNAARGFHITIPVAKRAAPPRLPSVFIQVMRGRGYVSCTTEHLYQLDQRSRDTLREILIMSNVIVVEMLVEARGRMGALHGLGEAVATLDLVVGLAHAAALASWVRPEFSHTLAIRTGRHPILDVLATLPPVPNNTFLSPENRVMVVTGPNMSGKSTYLRQIALIQVLAQIGSFVPAEFASVRLVRQIYTHLGSEDSPENNASTFQVQMSDVAHMLSGAGRESLVLLDELGSGTSVEEGAALAWAIMEALIHARATTVLATHALFLTRLANLYPCVANYHLESEDGGSGRLQLTHVVRKGVTRATNYGLAMAAITPIPPTVLQRAHALALTMTPPTQVAAEEESEWIRQRAVHRLAHRLLALAQATSSADSSLHTPGSGGNHEPEDRIPATRDYSSAHITPLPHLAHVSHNGGNHAPVESNAESRDTNEESNVRDGEAFSGSDARDKELKVQLEALLEEFLAQAVQPESNLMSVDDSDVPTEP
ncbi:mutS protein homolog 4 [Procambarus clarkii]|uniref:mutS protein homolog 4 n=1 Tax=Procambarus clarkii TaxID=6728 RepID=UPI0037438CA5